MKAISPNALPKMPVSSSPGAPSIGKQPDTSFGIFIDGERSAQSIARDLRPVADHPVEDRAGDANDAETPMLVDQAASSRAGAWPSLAFVGVPAAAQASAKIETVVPRQTERTLGAVGLPSGPADVVGGAPAARDTSAWPAMQSAWRPALESQHATGSPAPDQGHSVAGVTMVFGDAVADHPVEDHADDAGDAGTAMLAGQGAAAGSIVWPGLAFLRAPAATQASAKIEAVAPPQNDRTLGAVGLSPGRADVAGGAPAPRNASAWRAMQSAWTPALEAPHAAGSPAADKGRPVADVNVVFGDAAADTDGSDAAPHAEGAAAEATVWPGLAFVGAPAAAQASANTEAVVPRQTERSLGADGFSSGRAEIVGGAPAARDTSAWPAMQSGRTSAFEPLLATGPQGPGTAPSGLDAKTVIGDVTGVAGDTPVSEGGERLRRNPSGTILRSDTSEPMPFTVVSSRTHFAPVSDVSRAEPVAPNQDWTKPALTAPGDTAVAFADDASPDKAARASPIQGTSRARAERLPARVSPAGDQWTTTVRSADHNGAPPASDELSGMSGRTIAPDRPSRGTEVVVSPSMDHHAATYVMASDAQLPSALLPSPAAQVADAILPAIAETGTSATATRSPLSDLVAPGKLQTLVIALNPDHLGPVQVRMRLVGDDLHVGIVAQKRDAAAAIDAARSELADRLAGAGYRLSLDIATGSLPAMQPSSSNANTSDGQSNRSHAGTYDGMGSKGAEGGDASDDSRRDPQPGGARERRRAAPDRSGLRL